MTTVISNWGFRFCQTSSYKESLTLQKPDLLSGTNLRSSSARNTKPLICQLIIVIIDNVACELFNRAADCHFFMIVCKKTDTP